MLLQFMRLTKKLTGLLLGVLAVSVPVVNTLMCVIAIFFGIAVVLRLLA
jgi:hydrogenase/urease accessory protein HupE